MKAEKANYPVWLMCKVLQVSRSGFYAWYKRPPSTRERENKRLVRVIREAHQASRRTYGSPRIHEELKDRGFEVGCNRVARLMHENGIFACCRRRFRVTTNSAHGLPVADNVLGRSFTVKAPDRAWVTDITYVWTGEGWLYLAVVIDLFSRRVVGWSMSERIKTGLVLNALKMALGQRVSDAKLLHHSDRGSQYASHAYRKALKDHGITCSMSRKGDCWDNAVAESFFATLKTELVYRMVFLTRDAARAAIAEYIEVFYNRQRRHSHLGYMSPAKYEDKRISEFRKSA
jgi:transposase InsO family protein